MQNGTIFDPNQKLESTKLIDMDHMKSSITTFGNSIKFWKIYMVNGDNCNRVVNSYISELALPNLLPISFFQYSIICTKLFIDCFIRSISISFVDYFFWFGSNIYMTYSLIEFFYL